MLSDWAYIGFPPDSFWSATPREFAAVMDGHNRSSRDAFNRSVRQAHTTAVLGRVEKIPDIQELLIGGKPDTLGGHMPAGDGLAALGRLLVNAGYAKEG
jgi:hypothetical protein